MLARMALVIAMVGCDGGRETTEVRFVDVQDAEPPGALEVGSDSVADARVHLLAGLDERPGAPALVGSGPWRTRVMLRDGQDANAALERGRTYVVHGEADLRLDVRLGAGDRGAFQGGEVHTGAERAMVQVRLDCPSVLGARFRLSIVADDGEGGDHPRDVTPDYLARAVPKGRYRAWVDVPPGGGRYLVAVRVLDRRESEVAHAWASPIAVVRPWL